MAVKFVCITSTFAFTSAVIWELYGSQEEYQCNNAGTDDTCILHCDPDTQQGLQFDCGLAQECYFYCQDTQCLKSGSLNATSSTNLYAFSSKQLCYENAAVYTAKHSYFEINAIDNREFKKITINSDRNTESIFINCTGSDTEPCRQIVVNAQSATSLEIIGGASSTMEDASIQCPQNSNYDGPNIAPCVIDFSAGGLIKDGVFTTVNGIPMDIIISGQLQGKVTIVCNKGTSENNDNSFKNQGDCWNTHAPTSHPTFIPSSHPTQIPTKYPTFNPTLSPTKSPTKDPTKYPITLYPSLYPTKYPTEYPTKYPSTYPMRSPSLYPSIHPYNEAHVPIESTETFAISETERSSDIEYVNLLSTDIKSLIIVILVLIICVMTICICIKKRNQYKKNVQMIANNLSQNALTVHPSKEPKSLSNSLSNSLKKVASKLEGIPAHHNEFDDHLMDTSDLNMNEGNINNLGMEGVLLKVANASSKVNIFSDTLQMVNASSKRSMRDDEKRESDDEDRMPVHSSTPDLLDTALPNSYSTTQGNDKKEILGNDGSNGLLASATKGNYDPNVDNTVSTMVTDDTEGARDKPPLEEFNREDQYDHCTIPESFATVK